METAALTIYLIILGLCLVFSAFFSSSETALLSLPRSRVFRLAEAGPRGRLIKTVLAEPDKLLGAILLGNNLSNVAGSVAATAAALSLWGEKSLGPTAAGLTVLFLVLAEVTPKSLAAFRPETVSLLVISPLRLFMIVLNPVVVVLTFISNSILRLTGQSATGGRKVTREDILTLVSSGRREGYLDTQEQRMLKGILDLQVISVGEIMQPLSVIKALAADLDVAEAARLASGWSFSRFPVFEDSLEKIIGYVHLRDLVSAGPDQTLPELVHAPLFVPESRPVRDQLLSFRREQGHMAFVVDEFGQIEGLVTLEDVLEEIVGEIMDEYDTVSTGVKSVTADSYLVNGRLSIRDASRLTGFHLPAGPYNTIGGLVHYLTQKIPVSGEEFTAADLKFKIERMDGRAVGLVRISRQPAETPPAD